MVGHGARLGSSPMPRPTLPWLPALLAFFLPLAASRGATNATSGSRAVPVLLSLSPSSGPLDGGTQVELQVMSVNVSLPLMVTLRGVTGHGGVEDAPTTTVDVQRGEGEQIFFTMPNLGSLRKVKGGVLVSLGVRTESHRSQGRQKRVPHDVKVKTLAGPLFFRLLGPLASLAPAYVSPCCNYKISGGEVVVLSGSIPTAPANHATVRFRSASNQQEVSGQRIQEEWGVATISEDVPANAWHVYAATPPWPHAEHDVTVEISWNNQQFIPFASPVRFVDEKSVFGKLQEGISEKSLQHTEEEAQSQVEDADGTFDLPTEARGIDLTEALLLDKKGDAFILARSQDLSHLAEDLRMIHDLFILTGAAVLCGALVTCLQAPTIIGYLLGGIVVGPGCLDRVVELVQVESLAELGVCLLLFCIGLELTLEELLRNFRAACAAVLAMLALCGSVVFLAAFCTRTPVSEALIIGIFASLASTPVSLLAIPAEGGSPSVNHHNSDAEHDGDLSLGARGGESSMLLAILVTQDIVLACLLAGLPLLFHQRQVAEIALPAPPTEPEEAAKPPRDLLRHFGPAVAAVGCGLVVVAVLCWRHRKVIRRRLGPMTVRLSARLLKLQGDFFVMLLLGYAFACAYGTDNLGLSTELGAFLGGLALRFFAEDVAERMEHLVAGLKDTFVAWFFASIGLVVNPVFLFDNLRSILTVVMIIFVLKLVTGAIPLWLLAERGSPAPARASLRTAWILSHISEFGFILASKGCSWGVLSRHVYLLLVGANAVSLFLAPWLFKARDVLLPEHHEGANQAEIQQGPSPLPAKREANGAQRGRGREASSWPSGDVEMSGGAGSRRRASPARVVPDVYGKGQGSPR